MRLTLHVSHMGPGRYYNVPRHSTPAGVGPNTYAASSPRDVRRTSMVRAARALILHAAAVTRVYMHAR